MTSKEQENGTRVQNIGETIEDKVPVETANIQTRTKQQYNDIVTKKHQITNNKKKQQVMDKGTKQGKNQSMVIVNDKTYNFRSTSTRAKIEAKKRGKEDNIN